MKKYFIIPMMFLFLGCSVIAKPIENGESTSTIWHGYYNSNEVPDFDNLSFSQFKIDKNFINIKSGNFSTTTGEPLQNATGVYKIIKTLKDTSEEYQVLIIDALADNPVERILGLKKNAFVTSISEPVLWEEGMDTTDLNYKDYLYSDTYVDLSSVRPDTLTPDTTVLFDTFLEKLTAGKDSDIWVLTPVAKNLSLGLLGLVGMNVGTEIILFKECEKDTDGNPKLDNGQKIWGYARGKRKNYPLYYTPIPVADRQNKYGVFWFQGMNIFPLGGRRIEIPVMIHESKGINNIFAGTVNGIGSTADWDAKKHWLWLEKKSLDGLLSEHNILARKAPVVRP